MTIDEIVLQRIDFYKPRGHLEETAKMFLKISAIKHNNVKWHSERVALMSEAVAKNLKLDTKLAFFAGLMHDFGKLVLPYQLFEDREITQEEYTEIKTHALSSYHMLEDRHLVTAICAGFHHFPNYGLTLEDLPKNWSNELIEMVLITSTTVSVCDFIDAANHRHTKIISGTWSRNGTLTDKLQGKYPDKLGIIKAALAVSMDPIFRPDNNSSA